MTSSPMPVPLDHTPDILVIGGGLAALTAALTARKQGRTVAVASLGPVGRSGNTLMAENAIAGITGAPGNTPEAYANDLLHSGRGLANPALASALANISQETLLFLKEHGVPLPFADGRFTRLPAISGHSVPRTVVADTSAMGHAAKGRAYLEPLAVAAQGAGIPFLNGSRALRLLLEDGRVRGAVLYNARTGECAVQPAGKVILATGGYAGLFANTSNVAGAYGDGIALALLAGCPVRDMEMVQYFPAILHAAIRMVITTKIFPFGAVLRNSQGEAFMQRYDPAGDMATRDVMARAVFMEVQSGRGIDGCVHIDCTAIPEDAFDGPLAHLDDRLRRCGIDPRRDQFKGAPGAHYTMGGVVIDAHGRTPLPGLYAAGEVSGGVHGANRLGGAALMDAAAFGRLAGLAASQDEYPASPAGYDIPALPAPPGTDARKALDRDIKRLRTLLWEHASIIRNAEGLGAALRDIVALRETWMDSLHTAGQAFAGTLLTAEAVVRSALMRAESRGAHYRSDCPETDAAWAAGITCAVKNGELALERMA